MTETDNTMHDTTLARMRAVLERMRDDAERGSARTRPRISPRHAIMTMADQIRSLHAMGYSWMEIVRPLHD